MSPALTRTRSRRAAPLPAAERRAAIVAAVVPLLVKHGENVPTRQLAQAAGVSEGTIFNVFADKDELIDAAIDAVVDTAQLERTLAAIEPALPLEQRLVAATGAMQQRMTEIWRFVAGLGPRAHRQPTPLPDSVGLIALIEAHAGELRLPPVEAARLLRSLTIALTHPLLAPEPATAEAVVRTFLHGVAKERS